MDKINTDDLLVKILSFLPTKVAATTSILSKRWKFLWMWVPNQEYNDEVTKPSNLWSLQRFIKRNLAMHKVPVLESLRLKFNTLLIEPEDINQWVEIAVSRRVRYLNIEYSHYQKKSATLPIWLNTCKSLEKLTLRGTILMDVPRLVSLPSLKVLVLKGVRYLDESFRLLDVSHMVCFPSLQNLFLIQVDFFDKESLPLLLANCPVLEALTLARYNNDNVGAVSINVPSLEALSIHIESGCSSDGVEIVAPSLTYISLSDRCNKHLLIENMPKLEETDIRAYISDTKKFFGSFTSVKRLHLCVYWLKETEVWNVDAFCFNQLESLRICTRCPYWSILLVRFLKGSPKLKFLELYAAPHNEISTSFVLPLIRWDQLSPVPECLLTSLETFKLTHVRRTQEAIDMAAYITSNSRRLKSETTRGK